jgi:NADH dehydrogenase FAD-containing subunit
MTDNRGKHRLIFAVIGAGPTGIEFAAEFGSWNKTVPSTINLKFVRIRD